MARKQPDASVETVETAVGVNASEAAAAPAKSKAPAITTITMQDGKIVDFPGKRKMQKTAITDEKGIGVRLDFINGEFRQFYLPEALLHRFAIHGAEQKLGDEIAGVDTIDDCVSAIDDLIERLYNNEWTVKREANVLNGASILAKALVQQSGKSIQEVRAYLLKLSAAQKLALRSHKDVAPIVAELEAARVRKEKTNKHDSDALLDGLSNPLAPTSLGAADAAEDVAE